VRPDVGGVYAARCHSCHQRANAGAGELHLRDALNALKSLILRF
jgi:mono/diheme cytochrome c family protein